MNAQYNTFSERRNPTNGGDVVTAAKPYKEVLYYNYTIRRYRYYLHSFAIVDTIQ